MISIVITVIYSVLLLAASAVYLNKRYCLIAQASIQDVLKKHRLYVVLTIVVFISISVTEAVYLSGKDFFSLPIILKWTTLFWGLYLLAKIDFHEKIIPNKIIVAMLMLRAIFLVYEILLDVQYWKLIVSYPLFGAMIGGGIMLIATLISRNGVGMGDIKMYIVIGSFVGSTEIFTSMFLTFLVSAIGVLILLICRKLNVKDAVPMAPFAFVGITLEFVLYMFGG